MANNAIQQAIQNVQKAAQADITRCGQTHVDLLDAIRALNLAAETPAETLMRMRFEVCIIRWNLSPTAPFPPPPAPFLPP